jgi:outer membrane protein OmpA-like peptidoglycan-associated protein
VRVQLNANVLFRKDSAVLLPGAHARLREVAASIKAKGRGSVRVVGYTDDLGSAAHGLRLSRQRATAVAGFLRPLLPVADFAFTVAGRGEADPAAPNTHETNRRKNRRVELSYVQG